MAQRYVRVQAPDGIAYYGLLQPDRSVEILNGPPWLGEQLSGPALNSENYQFLAPCTPSKIIAVGKNYLEHAKEMGGEPPQEPLIFLKPPSALLGHGQEILYPAQSQQVDYEGELALIIGQACIDCPVEVAQDKIWGYTIANDVTARDLQRRDHQWTRAKGFDTFCPLGPWIVRELTPSARLQTFVNDTEQPRQSAAIDQMIFSPEALVAYISHVMRLMPGDVILTGTPAGVGPLRVGDHVRVEIEGIGYLENPVARRQT